MPRLRQVPKDEAHASARTIYEMLFGERDPVSSPGTATGSPGNWWTVFAAVPDCFDHALQGFAFYRSSRRKLSPQLRELGQTRAGFARGSRFVFSQHCKSCRDVGLSEEQIEAIPAWSVADCFSPVERAVLAYTDCLVLEGGRVPDAVFDALRAELSEVEILELTYITCTYEMHATMCRALRLEFDDVDDPITEVPAPGSGSADVMAAVDEVDARKDGGS
jgi:alkylhydroperoxidase family enzyme